MNRGFKYHLVSVLYLVVIIVIVLGLYKLWGFSKNYLIIGLVLLSIIIYVLDFTRDLLFLFQKIFDRANKSFWDLMIVLGIFVNTRLFVYSIAVLCIGLCLRLVYLMLSII